MTRVAMMPGMAQAKLESSGMKSPAVQAGAPHDAIHQERGAAHVAEVFKQQNEQEQDQDLRQEHNDAADTRNQTILNEALQKACRQGFVGGGTQRLEPRRNQFHDRLGPGKHRLKHHKEHAKKDEQSPHGMQKNTVDPGAQRIGPRWHYDGCCNHPIGLTLSSAQLRRCRG
jgi:hypothetical protein